MLIVLVFYLWWSLVYNYVCDCGCIVLLLYRFLVLVVW